MHGEDMVLLTIGSRGNKVPLTGILLTARQLFSQRRDLTKHDNAPAGGASIGLMAFSRTIFLTSPGFLDAYPSAVAIPYPCATRWKGGIFSVPSSREERFWICPSRE